MEEIKKIRDDLLDSRDIERTMKKFRQIPRNSGKVHYVEKLLMNFRIIQKLMGTYRLRLAKNNQLSMQYTNDGIQFLVTSDDRMLALGAFAKGISQAERSYESLPTCYERRSAVYLEWKEYENCLKNIRAARELRCTPKLLEDLKKREKICQELLAATPGPSSITEDKLTHKPNPKVPIVGDSVEVTYTESQECHLYSKTDLNPNDIIAIEEPFYIYVPSVSRYYQCSYCAEDAVAPVPCISCTKVLFCSKVCLEAAMKQFHKYECPVIDFLVSLLDDLHYAAIRLTFAVLNLFPTIEECIRFYNSPDSKKNLFDLNFANFSKVEYFKAINTWKRSSDKDSIVDSFQFAIVTAIVKRVLFTSSPLKDVLVTEAQRDFFLELLYHHIEICPHNLEAVTMEIDHHNGHKNFEIIALAAYGLHTFISESADPNINKVFKGAKCFYTAFKEIPAKSQLLQNLSPYSINEHRKVHGCYDGKLFDDLNFIDIPPKIKLREVIQLFVGDKDFAKEKLPYFCDYLKKFKEYYPCYQITLAEQCLWMSLNILADTIPLESNVVL